VTTQLAPNQQLDPIETAPFDTKPCQVIGLAELGLDASDLGFTGARQEITSVVAAAERTAGEVVEDDGQAHVRIVSYLESLKVV